MLSDTGITRMHFLIKMMIWYQNNTLYVKNTCFCVNCTFLHKMHFSENLHNKIIKKLLVLCMFSTPGTRGQHFYLKTHFCSKMCTIALKSWFFTQKYYLSLKLALGAQEWNVSKCLHKNRFHAWAAEHTTLTIVCVQLSVLRTAECTAYS